MTRIFPEPPSAIDSTESVRRLGSASVDALDQRIEQSQGARLELIEGIFYELRDGEWHVVRLYGEADLLRAAPFGDTELELESIWVDPRLP